jgi:hypothetical protein
MRGWVWETTFYREIGEERGDGCFTTEDSHGGHGGFILIPQIIRTYPLCFFKFKKIGGR